MARPSVDYQWGAVDAFRYHFRPGLFGNILPKPDPPATDPSASGAGRGGRNCPWASHRYQSAIFSFVNALLIRAFPLFRLFEDPARWRLYLRRLRVSTLNFDAGGAI
jgi:hypothetical protein